MRPNLTRVTIVLTKKQHEEFKAYAKVNYSSLSDFLRNVAKNEIEKSKRAKVVENRIQKNLDNDENLVEDFTIHLEDEKHYVEGIGVDKYSEDTWVWGGMLKTKVGKHYYKLVETQFMEKKSIAVEIITNKPKRMPFDKWDSLICYLKNYVKSEYDRDKWFQIKTDDYTKEVKWVPAKRARRDER